MEARVDTSFFWLRRIHSLMGVMLLAILILHFTIDSFVFVGPSVFDRAVRTLHAFPLMPVIEIAFVVLPLVLYILMGLVIVYRSSANVVTYSYYRNWIYFLQRISGLIAFMFVIFYVWSVRLMPSYVHLQQQLAPLWVRIFYIVGIMALVFHLANSAASALITWGITQGKRSQFAVHIASWVLVIAMWFWGLWIVFAFSR